MNNFQLITLVVPQRLTNSIKYRGVEKENWFINKLINKHTITLRPNLCLFFESQLVLIKVILTHFPLPAFSHSLLYSLNLVLES